MARFIYIDETGSDGYLSQLHPILRVVGVIVDESQVQLLGSLMQNLAQQSLGSLPDDFEFHGSDLWGGGSFWMGLSRETRLTLYESVIGILSTTDSWIAHSNINKLKLHQKYNGEVDQGAYRLGLQFLLEKVDLNSGGYRQIVVADELQEQVLLSRRMFKALQSHGWGEVPGRNIKSIIDSLHFIRSEESAGVQMADMVAFVIQRALSGRDQHPNTASSMKRMYGLIESRTKTYRDIWP
jgi:Protein of unknown function (DUF3800)